MRDARRLRYGPFRLAPGALQFFILLLPLLLTFALQALHETTVRCQRDKIGLSCTVRESPSGVGGDPFTPVSARSTREVVRSRSGPHVMGRVIVLDTQGREHQSLDVSHDDSVALASALQRFIGDGTEAHFDQSLDQFSLGAAVFGAVFFALGLLLLGSAVRGSGSVELSLGLDRERLTLARKYCGVTFSRYELNVARAAAVEIQWFRQHGRHGPGDLFGRLCVATPNGNVFIPSHYARGRQVHLRGAAQLRELLHLTPMHDHLFEPELAHPELRLVDRAGTVLFGVAIGIFEGRLLVASLSLLLGPRPLPIDLSPLWLIAVGAGLGGLIAPQWARQRLDDGVATARAKSQS